MLSYENQEAFLKLNLMGGFFMFNNLLKRKNMFLFMAAFSVPLNTENWEMLTFSRLKANTFKANSQRLTIHVNQSSSPLIQKFKSPVTFTRVVAKGEIKNGSINLKENQEQGLFNKKSITDDYVLRLGLVLEGDNRKPRFLPTFMLPGWIKRLFSLAPKNRGIDKIYFLKVVHNASHLGDKRTHPLHEYLYEKAITQAKTGAFTIDKTFESPRSTYGLWLSANGEGTKSKFDTIINSIEFY